MIVSCLAATWLVWGSTYLAIRFALVGFQPFFMMATRFLCAGVLLMAWQLLRRAALPSARQWLNALLVGTLMLGGGMGGTAYAEETVASGLVVSFIAVVPLFLRTHPQPAASFPRARARAPEWLDGSASSSMCHPASPRVAPARQLPRNT
jgi:hypothetical protein